MGGAIAQYRISVSMFALQCSISSARVYTFTLNIELILKKEKKRKAFYKFAIFYPFFRAPGVAKMY